MLHFASVCCEKMKFVTWLVQVLLSTFFLVLTWDYGTGTFLGWHFLPCDASPGPSSSLLLHGRSPVTDSGWLWFSSAEGTFHPQTVDGHLRLHCEWVQKCWECGGKREAVFLCHILGFFFIVGKHWNSLCQWERLVVVQEIFQIRAQIEMPLLIKWHRKYAAFFVEWKCFLFFLPAGAQVSVSMEDIIEVYRGDSAHIRCQYSFAQDPNMVMVQWFVVCTVHLFPLCLPNHWQFFHQNYCSFKLYFHER